MPLHSAPFANILVDFKFSLWELFNQDVSQVHLAPCFLADQGVSFLTSNVKLKYCFETRCTGPGLLSVSVWARFMRWSTLDQQAKYKPISVWLQYTITGFLIYCIRWPRLADCILLMNIYFLSLKHQS